jgi:response regulator RpfG family c-di-GMP phosphodiesterase
MQRATENPAMPLPGPLQRNEPKPTLLFVDDEERILRSLRMLFAANYRVLVTTSGLEALEILKREKVHALISDQRMPVMAGVDLLRQAREIAPNTMRLLLTGYSDIEAIIGSINDGEVFRYINKPWNADDIRSIVGEAAGIAISLDRSADSPPLQPLGGKAQSLLLIDDCPETASELRGLIEESFPRTFALEWATSLGEAMAILEQKDVSIVVSEIQVGNEDMTPFLKTLKRFKPHVVTIVLTSFKDASLLVGLINQGQVHRFLPKPMRRVMTVRGIQSGIDRSREIQSRPDIVQRHKVDAPIKELEPGLISRIRGLFTRAEKPLHTP